MRSLLYLFLIIVSILILSCIPEDVKDQEKSLGDHNINENVDPITNIPKPLVTIQPPTVTGYSPITGTAHSPPTSVPRITVTHVNTPTSDMIYQFCSPLGEQSIKEIPEIVSDPYSPPAQGKEDRHHGVDLAYYRRKDRTTIRGEYVQSWLPGQVAAVVHDRLPYGNMVIIETNYRSLHPAVRSENNIMLGESIYTLYGHLENAPAVSLGDWVACGDILGTVGATGYNIVNPHLHIETRVGPAEYVFVEGMVYYDTRSTDDERTNYELWRTSGVFRHFDPIDLLTTLRIELNLGQ